MIVQKKNLQKIYLRKKIKNQKKKQKENTAGSS